MPYINHSTLTYPATNAFPNGIWEDVRNPTSTDFRNYAIGVIWINVMNQTAYIMVRRTSTLGTWVQMATAGTGILTLTDNNGVPVGPNGANNVNLIGAGTLTVAGNIGTNTLTISQNGTVATSYVTDLLGPAIPLAGVLRVIGGIGVQTSGVGNTLTINAQASVPTRFTADTQFAIPAANNLNVFGGVGIATSGDTMSTLTISTKGSVAIQYTTDDTLHATPAGNNLNIFGTAVQGISTNSAGSTVTITATNASAVQKGVASFNGTQFTVAAGAVSSNPITLANGNNITITGSPVNLGGTATVNVSGTTNHSILLGNATGSINSLGVATNGQLPIGSTGADPVLSTLTAGAGINITNGAGTITITNTSAASLTFTEDSGSTTPTAGGVIFIRGGAGISTMGNPLTNTITITNNGGAGVNKVINQTFTSGGTYTPSNNMLYCQIQILGGGGAGGGAVNAGVAQYSSGGGGGAGEYAVGIFTAAAIGASQAVTIGAGGTGVAGGNGNSGGNSSVGALISSNGGSGGISGPLSTGGGLIAGGGAGGTGGSGGNYRTPGAPGINGLSAANVSVSYGGTGASSQLGSGGLERPGFNSGNNALGYGAGGNGANQGAGGALAGGTGTAGIVVITEYTS